MRTRHLSFHFWRRHDHRFYKLVSIVVVCSLLLQPLSAMAAVYRSVGAPVAPTRAANPSVVESNKASAAGAPRPTQARHKAAVMPAPKVRMAAQVNPTPSGAKPAYPPNHILDTDEHAVGVPPANYDLESAGYGIGTPPANYDFSVPGYEVGPLPNNPSFETGNFTGWSISGNVTLQSDANSGQHWARLSGPGELISDPIVIPANVQQVVFDLNHLGGTSSVEVHVLSGLTYAVETNIMKVVCPSCDVWGSVASNVTPYQGQSIKLKIKQFLPVPAKVDVDNFRFNVLAPDYIIEDKVSLVTENNGNVYARLPGDRAAVTTAPFLVDPNAHISTVKLMGLTAGSDQYRIELLSGATFEAIKNLQQGTVENSWTSFDLNLADWTNQQIRLRISSFYRQGAVGVDDIGLQEVSVPGWSVTNDTTIENDGHAGNGTHYIATNGILISAPFTLAADAQQLSLLYSGRDAANQFNVKLLRKADPDVEVMLAPAIPNEPTTWKTLKISLGQYAGETVRLQLERVSGRVYFDDIGLSEFVLPGWWPQGISDAISGGEDAYGSYITSAQPNGSFRWRSEEIMPGIIDNVNRTDFRFYAIAYALNPGGYLKVYWVDSQGQTRQIFGDAVTSATGYRERYFGIADFYGQPGYLVIHAAVGKVYSVGDNIARQQLAEPFAYKVGARIDTSTGSFGYHSEDLATEGWPALSFTRYYNGHSDRPGSMGHGWSHSYETRLVFTDDGDVGVIFGSGKEIFFRWNGFNQAYEPADTRVHDTLEKNGDGTYTYKNQGASDQDYATDSSCSLLGLRHFKLLPQRQEYQFTANGVLTTIHDASDRTLTLQYDGAGRVQTVASDSGAVFTLAYNGDGRLATVSDILGASASYTYDGVNGDLVSAARSSRGVESYTYNRHRLETVVAASGHLLFRNTFDNLHRIIRQSDALEHALVIDYNTPAAGVTRVTAPDGEMSYFYYDFYQRTTDWVAPTGQITSYLYDSVGNLQKVIDSGFGEWNFSYDADANLLGIADPQGNPLQFTYNPEHLPTTMVDGNGNVTNFVYDGNGNVERITNSLEESVFTYNPAGQLASMTTPWLSESYTYFSNGDLATRTDALGHTWNYVYDQNSRLTAVTDPNQHTTQYFYDLAGRLIAIRNHLAQQKNFLYDLVGHLIMAEDELGRRTLWDYNEVGLAVTKTDPAGYVTTYAYDENRNLTAMTDPNGLTTQYGYDADNRLLSIQQPGNRLTQYVYDGCGHVIQEINPQQKSINYQYDSSGRLTNVRFSNDIQYDFAYDGNGNLTSKVDPYAVTTTYGYDALNRLTAVSDGAGVLATYGYDAANRKKSATNALGATITYAYDDAGRLTSVTDPLLRITTFAYDAAGNRTSVTDPLNGVESVVYDALNRPVMLTDAANNQTQLAYDGVGQLTQITAPTNATSTFVYDPRGLPTTIARPLNQTLNFVYDPGGRVVQRVDSLNQSTSYQYNSVGQVSAVTDPLGHTTHYSYDAGGNLTTIADPLGRTQSFTYDDFNRPATMTDAAGLVSWFEYDWRGQLATLGTPDRGVTTFAYNDRGLLTTVHDALGHDTAFVYDGANRRTQMIDPRGNPTHFAYDAANRLTSMTDALGGVASYSYDDGDRLTALTNPNGKTTTYSYDLLDNVITQHDPLARTYTFGYDQYGRRTSATDPRGVAVGYGYDLLDRLTTVTHPNGVDSYAYDALDRLTTVSDQSGVTTLSYDAASRLTAVAAPQGTVAYTYNDADQRTGMTLPGNRTVSYGYDSAGRLNAITDWASRTATLAYDTEGRVGAITRPNSVSSDYSYAVDGSLAYVQHNPSQMFYSYSFDNNNNRVGLNTPDGAETYSYDALNRLVQATYANGDSASYSYDANGNRLSETFNGATTNYSYDDAGQLLSDGATTYSYDANGNLVTAGADSYSWDWANRLTGATVNGQNVNYSYDAMNVRVGATVNGVTNNLLWDRATALPSLVDDGSYAYLHGLGAMAQIDGAGARHDLVTDGLGSVRGVTDGSGALVGRADYSVFGAYRNQTGVASRFGFGGEYFAQESGLWHLRARDLNPTLGRFLSADPVQPNAPGTQGYNLYAYVANNPTTWLDPSGYSTEGPTPIQAAILVGLLVSVPAAALLPGAAVGAFVLAALTFHCILTEGCNDLLGEMNSLIGELGSSGLNTVTWTAETLNEAFAKYPLLPEASLPLQFMAGIGLGAVGLDTVTDLAALVSGRDPLTGQALTPQDMFITWLAFSLPLVSATMLHGFADDAAEVMGGLHLRGEPGCSFSQATPVATDEGDVAISAIQVGDQVLAWDEARGATGYYTVTATLAQVDPVVVKLTIDGETIKTTPEHPFYKVETAPWVTVGATEGRWTPAGELHAGDQILQADGTTSVVQTVVFEATPQVMYNLTVADAHTYTVGDGEWVVHNACNWLGGKPTRDKIGNQLVGDAQRLFYRLDDEWKRTVIAVAQGGNEKIVTAFINTNPQALREIERLAPLVGARYVAPTEIRGIFGSGHAEQIAYRELQQYVDLKIGISRYAGPCSEYCQPFFADLGFINLFWPKRR
ncbi:MAG: polymorphic toxin-type HINT domain-containing protein [Caldilineaceae bacterium]